MTQGDNLTAFYLKQKGINLKDDFEENIPSLTFQGNRKYDITYKPKFIFYDVLAKRTKLKKRKIIYIRHYSDLEKRGFCLVSVSTTKRWFKGQQVIYRIKRRDRTQPGEKILTGIPDRHKIQFDEANNQIQLIGINAGRFRSGGWINLSTPLEGEKRAMSSEQMMAKMYGSFFLDESNRFKKVYLNNDVPIMITYSNKLVCIPQKRDAIVMAIVGLRGHGKTTVAHGFMDRIFWLWKIRLWIGNDNMQETLTWDKPNTDFKETLEEMNETPIGLPIVNVLPYTNSLVLNHFKKESPIAVMCIPFVDMIKRVIWAGSEVYIHNLIEDFMECKTEKGIMDVVEEKITVLDDEDSKGFKSMKIKIKNFLRHLFDKKLCDINVIDERTDFGNIVCMMRKGKKINYVFPTLMDAGVVPSINTFDLLTYDKRRYHYLYLAAIYAGIYDYQNSLDEKERVPIYGFIDELQKIMSTRQTINPAGEAINNMVQSGRPIQLGLVYCTQNYMKISHEVRSNTTYCIAMRHKSSKECKEIERDFNLEKYHIDKLLSFQKFEAIALTTEDDGFVLYDEFGNKESTSDPQIGVTLPSLSLHKKPGGI